MPSIGIIGAGQIGRALAAALARHRIPATLSNSRRPDSLKALVASLGPSIEAGTRESAAAKELVVVAVNWSRLRAALAALPSFAGRIVVDANNPVEAPTFAPADLGGLTSSEMFARLVPGARVVKAFNHLRPELLAASPSSEGGQRVLFHAGDNIGAKREVGALMTRLGFFGVDLGALASGGRSFQFPSGPLSTLNLVKFE